MRRTLIGVCNGFTLLELLIVIAILGILAAVVLPNVGTFIESGKVFASIEPAKFNIYYYSVEDPPIQIDSVVLGEIHILLPRHMFISDSAQVSLEFVPAGQFASAGNIIYDESKTPAFYYEVSSISKLYPWMIAELKGVNFKISRQNEYIRVVPLDSTTIWTWIISPTTVGEQILIIELHAPVYIESLKVRVGEAIYSGTFSIRVKGPFNWNQFWINIGITIGALAGSLSIFMRMRVLFRRKKQKQNSSQES